MNLKRYGLIGYCIALLFQSNTHAFDVNINWSEHQDYIIGSGVAVCAVVTYQYFLYRALVEQASAVEEYYDYVAMNDFFDDLSLLDDIDQIEFFMDQNRSCVVSMMQHYQSLFQLYDTMYDRYASWLKPWYRFSYFTNHMKRIEGVIAKLASLHSLALYEKIYDDFMQDDSMSLSDLVGQLYLHDRLLRPSYPELFFMKYSEFSFDFNKYIDEETSCVRCLHELKFQRDQIMLCLQSLNGCTVLEQLFGTVELFIDYIQASQDYANEVSYIQSSYEYDKMLQQRLDDSRRFFKI